MFIETSEIGSYYKNLIDPINFFQGWSDREFLDWCELGTTEDLKFLLIELEKSELYRKCAVVKKLIP